MRNLLKIFPLIALLGGCAHLGQSEAPHKYGATTAPRVAIVNGSNTPLPSYQFSDMPVGLIVMDTTGQNWQLTASTSAVNHTSVEAVTSNPGLRWLTYSGGGGGTYTGTSPIVVTGTVISAPLVQPSNAVAITGGTITGVNIATSSAQGAMSAADKAFLDTMAWQRSAWAFCQSKVAGLTGGPDFMKLGQSPNGLGLAATTDPGVQGGGLQAASAVVLKLGATIVQNAATGAWCFVYRAKFGAAASTSDAEIGITSAAHDVAIVVINSVDTTHYVLELVGTGTTNAVGTVVNDGAMHDFAVTFDPAAGTPTVTMWVDQVSAATITTLTNLTSDAVEGYLYHNVAGSVAAVKFAVGYVAP